MAFIIPNVPSPNYVDNVGPTINAAWLNAVDKAYHAVQLGINQVAILAKTTSGGSNGSLTFVNGVLTAYSPPS